MKTALKAVLAAVAMTVIGIGAAQASEAKPKVALVTKSLANEFHQNLLNGAIADQKARANEYDLIANGIKNEGDVAGQVQLVEQMIVNKVDALVLAPADSKALIPVVKKAIDAGILVINIDNNLDVDTLKSKGIHLPFVGPDNRKGAKLVGEYLAGKLTKGDKVAIIEGIPTAFNAQQRTLGFKDSMTAAGMNIVSLQSGQWEIDKANTIASSLLTEYPDLKAILCGNDSMAIGAIAAVKSASKTGKVHVIGFDNLAAVQPMLNDGRLLATVEQHGSKLGVYGIDVALKAIKDKVPQNKIDALIETPVDLAIKK
ncbi:sugar ABC transporter substrate-binding protein [Telmatospirillum sp.]|uniref:sugar ABC transporter substrate-binding protein n=1 Tax=Telmatospirillum sp. TaxID=2079197 RepID=UPI0028456078|nr:sugar ABC transporter substrate-binding protein [Telmatospirillum sp.]MDR3435573.1 sugar ABC transporter substrate-binding protein [Telmatospirillum sp.]